MIRAFFHTAEGTVYIRMLESALPTYRIPLLRTNVYLRDDPRELSHPPLRVERRYDLVERCDSIAYYTEVVE